MVAVAHLQRFGEGQLVDISAQEALANIIRPNISFWSYMRDPRAGRLKRGPRRVLACKDGYLCVVVVQESHWANLVRMMGEPEWTQCEQFAVLMEGYFADYTKAELFEMSQSYHIPLFPLFDASEVLSSDQYQHRSFWVKMAHTMGGTYQYPAATYVFSATQAQTLRPAPLLGQDNEEVFCQLLGNSPENLRDLCSAGVVHGTGRLPGSMTPQRPVTEENSLHRNSAGAKKLPL